MINEVKRKAELVICSLLQPSLPKMMIFPSRGGTDTGDATFPEPPFLVVAITEAEKVLAQESTWQTKGLVCYVTNMSDTSIVEHSKDVGNIYDAMVGITTSAGWLDSPRGIIMNGLDVGETDEFNDQGRQCHGDTISFTAGWTDREART